MESVAWLEPKQYWVEYEVRAWPRVQEDRKGSRSKQGSPSNQDRKGWSTGSETVSSWSWNPRKAWSIPNLPCFRLELPSQLEPHTYREQASRELMGQEMGAVIPKDGTGMVTALPSGIILQGQSGPGASL